MSSRRQPVAWGLLLIPAVAQLLLHLLTTGRYGIFRDEYYYLACSAHPAWGYVDHPPLSIWILSIWTSVFGDSVHSIRILPAISTAALVLLTGVLAAGLGGRRWAQVLAGLAASVGALALILGGFYSMNGYDLLVWTAAYILLVRIADTGHGRWWPWLGLVLGIGLLNKVGLLVFGVALSIALLATQHRRHLADLRLWLGGAIAASFLIPYVIWNALHGWPTLEFIENAKQYKITDTSPLGFLTENILEANPLSLPVWLGGLAWLLFASRAARFRIVGLMFLLSFVLMVAQKSKPYYLGASFPVLWAAGGAAWEGWTQSSRWRWSRWLLVATLLVGAVIVVPMSVPLFSLEGSVAHMERLHIVPNTGEDIRSAAPQYFSDRFGWEELAREVARVYDSLPAGERENTVIVTSNYGQAGALDYWSRRHELPPVYSRHNNYWLWGPPPETSTVLLAIGFGREVLEARFEEVSTAGRRVTPHAVESDLTVWICRGPRTSMAETWPAIRLFV
jgi:hypothetical protein